jgi:predicted esterase
VSFQPQQLLELANVSGPARQLLEFIADPVCAIDIHQLRYNSVDPLDQSAAASGALMIPTGSDPACQGPRPIVVYAHGTVAERDFNIANLADTDNAEGLLIALVFAGQGYVVVAPNYAGYDTSSLTYHPYLHAQQQANDVLDAVTAARSALPASTTPTVTDSGRLFITGYSQGGFVAMAAHRLFQQNGVAVTASAPMSGPYALAAFGDAVFMGQVVGSAPLFVSWLATSYDRVYGDVYGTPGEMFEARYAPTIETLLPTASSRSALYDAGSLPREQLFSSTPPDPAYAGFTPATQPADLAPVFARGFGPDALVTNSYRLAYLQDAQLNPDGGFPTRTNGVPAAAPVNGLRKAFKANDLRTWTPTAPVLLCAGHDDPTVLYMNTELMQRYWQDQGASTFTVLDVDGEVSLDDPYVELTAAFNVAKETVAAQAVAGGATDGGAAAVADVYHSTLVPPFCLAATRDFFDARR